ncbi:hypothetical protein CC1G_08043 [Coprinopsis cinerea okayama7|uniref:BTB domain-containing protein n=1 Tax=Coprinopsis cinerea (strain Okayama-7 / 130 / ATCC MYA-4618 / FGSC 9003) TaxID=240176 RepID=A8NQD8_COPC7|nr:hypothetical protein CC1G_08043 [Coprinopsis cinerea okayama7\|eukprot:XP_001835534.2 hypothetical protein CC1G_08043 [Coprinopsis cinerea okayama7\
MVQLHIFDPVEKLRHLSRLWSRGSKRRQALVADHALSTQAILLIDDEASPEINEQAKHVVCGRELVRDSEYYKDEAGDGLCIFRAGNVLFRVHRCLLMREPSVFRDMLSLPRPAGATDGVNDDNPIPVDDDPEHLRDLLWAFYAPQFCLYTTSNHVPLERLLNIADLANKYCIDFYESWSMEKVYSMMKEDPRILRTGSPETCARILHLAYINRHSNLYDLATRSIVSRLLWSDMDPRPIRDVGKRHGLRKILGPAYYRELLRLEAEDSSSNAKYSADLDASRKAFSEARMAFLCLWERLRDSQPSLSHRDCWTSPQACNEVWRTTWREATAGSHCQRNPPLDVLGRLRSAMRYCKKNLPANGGICISCTMEALEAIAATRDDVIERLYSYFCPQSEQ